MPTKKKVSTAKKTLRTKEMKNVKGGSKAMGGPILAGWDVKQNVKV